jgi:GxxExxY protein
LGACFEVYREKGCGFLENVFQECLAHEFSLQNIPALPHVRLQLHYKGRPLRQHYVVDFVCLDKIVLELKAVSKLIDERRAQTLNYLHATGMKVGLLVNFGHFPKLEHERFIL